MARYSVLTTDERVLHNRELIEKELAKGIKIIAFCNQTLGNELREGHEPFVAVKLLQIYKKREDCPNLSIIDGTGIEEKRDVLELLGTMDSRFNLEQYRIEHQTPDKDLIVEAGAGTGKTTVMIDRIMFLIHMVDGLSFEDIGMITFTNAATQNMKHKIQEKLLERFRVTKSPRYALWLEDVSKVHIQTIDSFYKEIISEIGTSIGYSSNISLRSYKYEKQQIIYDVLNEYYGKKKTGQVQSVLGEELYKLNHMIYEFWGRLEMIGLTDDEILALDWGKASDKSSGTLHETLRAIFPELNHRYSELKMQNDAIAVEDIVRELRKILEDGRDIILRSKPLKYLFVDEFQDSDNAQINTIVWLKKKYGLRLFVVGDIKQSIYRFRGAVETAFERLRRSIDINMGIKLGESLPLARNYRTSKAVLDQLHPIFQRWSDQKLLRYKEPLLPQNRENGSVTIKPLAGSPRSIQKAIEKELLQVLNQTVADCMKVTKEKEEEELKRRGGKALDKTWYEPHHVTVLTRTNWQLEQVKKICDKAGIPCYARSEGTLFSSQAARDLFALVRAYAFPGEVKSKFDLLASSFYSETVDLEIIKGYGNRLVELQAFLTDKLEEMNWTANQRAFRLYPTISVIQKMIDNSNLYDRYAAARKAELLRDTEWTEEALLDKVHVDTEQYRADLEKILEMLRGHFVGQMTSLYQIHSYLQINIATNQNEDEPDIAEKAGPGCVYGMTVHKAKGLEFDTVIIPFTNRLYRKKLATEILIDENQDPRKVGWSQVEKKKQKSNSYYEKCLGLEFDDIDREEARLLYVAMTRCQRRLECFAAGSEEHSWAHLLEV